VRIFIESEIDLVKFFFQDREIDLVKCATDSLPRLLP
jgi:hypothetical protein